MENSQEYTVTFKGFKTEEQAIQFAKMFDGGGEQYFEDIDTSEGYMSVNTDTAKLVEMYPKGKGYDIASKDNNVDIPLKIFLS